MMAEHTRPDDVKKGQCPPALTFFVFAFAIVDVALVALTFWAGALLIGLL
ncbi:hypothetical protein [Rhizobium sp. 18065]|nr:hypothetical protein [Rhizobium sp. 18065]